MMEIKYQGWNGKQMLNVVRIHLDADGAVWWSNDFKQLKLYNAEHYPMRRYTGLLDKNKKEIYGGDILKNGSTDRNSPKLITVVWNERDGAFNGKVGVSRLPLSCSYWFYGNCEVIGNIYENPELLEKE